MQGLVLPGTVLVTAAISVIVAVFAGLMAASFQHLHDMFSLLVFFGIFVVLRPVGRMIASKLTAPQHTPHG